ncbi:hypothetical protein BT96DRAFT_1009815 [Gymnopus androsaceus JB14]|uniref:Uncharacterized protein n=1 Tax=Gymnopus androsaceus JB14 TaxID=1447944 RepID=A0A6A4GBU5_9AGAR|nr:hypothetical protein BT96DRAFT_1009815 [Gymnopus androsaceus JB14]
MESLMTELLHEILDYIAYERNALREQGIVGFKRPTKDLVSLSLVNRRIREIASPFLFKHAQIDRGFKVVRLLEWCHCYPELSKLVKIMRFDGLGYSEDSCPENVQLWLRLLPCLPSLDRIEVGDYGYPNSIILEAMHKHSKVSSIIFDNFKQMPTDVHLPNMSKIIVKCYEFLQKDFSKVAFSYFVQGMVVNELVIPRFDWFDRYLATEHEAINVFSGLRKITLGTSDRDISLSELPRFITSCCPNVEFIQFIGTGGHLDGVPSISGFFQRLLEIDERGWMVGDKIRTTLSRQSTTMPSESLGQWLIIEMFLHIKCSLYDILSLICEFFPNLEHLELLFNWNEMYHIDDAVKSLEHFRSLRTLVTSNLFRQLYSEQPNPTRPANFPAGDEARVLWYASRIVQGIPSLETFHFDEHGLGDRNLAYQGCLEAKSKSNGDIVETLKKK